jgi:hypothetical protein
MVACPSMPIEQEDIMPLKPPFGTDMWKLTVEPLMVPCIDPFPIMFLPVSRKLIVPVTLLPVCVTVQLISSCPVLSAEVPAHVPLMVAPVAGVGDGLVGPEELPPHAATARPARSATPLR